MYTGEHAIERITMTPLNGKTRVKKTKNARIWTQIYDIYRETAGELRIATSDLMSLTLYEAAKNREIIVKVLTDKYGIDKRVAEQMAEKIIHRIQSMGEPRYHTIRTW